ncbi:MAG: hypothetical protein K0R54_4829 [Clostridiaceae bacterium]|jgi:hypothetical protein|nr:hypothetical protein [Clostridiaceae bacterium]
MSIYSDDRLKNGSAENNLENWITQNAIAVLGGLNGDKCFKVNANGVIAQSFNTVNEASAILIKGAFLPEIYSSDINLKTSIRITLNYGDGLKDIHVVPCKGSDNNGY